MFERMLNRKIQPTRDEMAGFCGKREKNFTRLNKWLTDEFGTEQKIVFPYGNSYGWGVAHRLKGKLICNIFAECGSFTVMLRLSDKQFEEIRDSLSEYANRCIDNRYPCGDGGWIHYRLNDIGNMNDITELLTAKCS